MSGETRGPDQPVSFQNKTFMQKTEAGTGKYKLLRYGFATILIAPGI